MFFYKIPVRIANLLEYKYEEFNTTQWSFRLFRVGKIGICYAWSNILTNAESEVQLPIWFKPAQPIGAAATGNSSNYNGEIYIYPNGKFVWACVATDRESAYTGEIVCVLQD